MNLKPYIIGILCVWLTACSNISEEERYIYVKPAQAARCILIEDFTGQRCVNCPTATAEIEKLQQQYGADTIIAVGIHSGPLGFAGNATNIGLMTDTGNEYYNYWHVEYQPAGIINRNGGVLSYTDWQAKVYNELQKKAPLTLKAVNNYDETSRMLTINVNAMGTDGDSEGFLQLWIVEDNITAMQLRYNIITDPGSGQITDREYRHSHVFRTAVNGTWGDAFSIHEGEERDYQFSYKIPEDWDVSSLSVIAFVYNSQGVLQVTRQAVTPRENS